MLIKICGVCDPKLALKVAQLGADFIGLIFHEPSKRYVAVDQAIAIANCAKQGGAQPVGVFVEHNADEIIAICEQTGIETVQLHGEIAKNAHKDLPENFTRIYVVNVNYDGFIIEDEKVSLLNKQRDFLLYDGINYGSGKTFNLDNFTPQREFRFFLAGGLNINNVKIAVSKVKPFGVDVSSGVENELGKKDLNLIKQFINQARMKS